jgi:multiple RNA-binding domain-containing protein 1
MDTHVQVAEAVAAHLDITKAELLDPSAPDMAVRQALGETQVIAATKSALSGAGNQPRRSTCGHVNVWPNIE